MLLSLLLPLEEQGVSLVGQIPLFQEVNLSEN
jgi:hypothetical protein